MNLGRAERIDGADCWRVNKVPGGLASFPTYSVDFDEAGMTEFHPVHYMFNHPQVNSFYSSGGIEYPESINVAVAVAMEDGGLITPVLKDPCKTDLFELSRVWKDLVKRSRSKQLELSKAIKRARFLGLMSYTNKYFN